jgi:hypothetical protein
MKTIRKADIVCVLILLALPFLFFSPAIFTGRVLLPADTILLMRPWGIAGLQRFPNFHFAQNQMHGPIFEYYSWRHYAREQMRKGIIPLWNPYELGGNVLLANNQSAVLYPLNLLLYILPLPTGMNILTLLHSFLTGFFLYGLLRTLGRSSIASLTASGLWMFCGLQIVWTEFQTPTAALCWLPAGLWAWELSKQKKDIRIAFIGSGCAVAMELLAGHLQFAFYGILALAIYAIARSWNTPLRTLFALIGCILFGISLSAVSLIPVVEMSRLNFRGAHDSYARSIGLRLPPENLLTLLQPDVFGNPKDYVAMNSDGMPVDGHPYIGKYDFIEYCFYLGIPGLFLGMLGGWLCLAGFRYSDWRDDSVRSIPLLLIAVVGLLLALGSPLCALFFYGLPGYKQFHATARSISLFCFGISSLAAWGMDALRQHNARIARPTIIIGVCIFITGLAAFPGLGLWKQTLLSDFWYSYELAGLKHFGIFFLLSALSIGLFLSHHPSGDPIKASNKNKKERKTASGIPFDSRKSFSLSRITPILLAAAALADLYSWGISFNPATNPGMLGFPTQTTDFLKNAYPDRILSLEYPGDGKNRGIHSMIVPNYNAVCHLREVQGADSLHTLRYHQLLQAVSRQIKPDWGFPDPNTLHVPGADNPFFDMMDVKYVTTVPEDPLNSNRFQRIEDDELTIWQNPRAHGLAWMTGSAVQAHGAEETASILDSPNFDFRKTAILDQPPPVMQNEATADKVQITDYQSQMEKLDVSGNGSGLLVLSEIAFPGWIAAVDGHPQKVITANYILRAVPVSKGHHEVIFNYRPMSYCLGLYITCVGASALAWLLTIKLQFHIRKI